MVELFQIPLSEAPKFANMPSSNISRMSIGQFGYTTAFAAPCFLPFSASAPEKRFLAHQDLAEKGHVFQTGFQSLEAQADSFFERKNGGQEFF